MELNPVFSETPRSNVSDDREKNWSLFMYVPDGQIPHTPEIT